jgi:hypothetical protein
MQFQLVVLFAVLACTNMVSGRALMGPPAQPDSITCVISSPQPDRLGSIMGPSEPDSICDFGAPSQPDSLEILMGPSPPDV